MTGKQSGGTDDGAEFFDKDHGFVPSRLGGALHAESPLRLGHDRRLWRYTHGVYRPADDWVKLRVRQRLGERCRKRHIDEVLAWLRADEPTLSERPPERYLNVRNGLLDWRTGELHPHTPDVPSTVQLPVAWDPAATCPHIDTFLAQVLPDESVGFIEELTGYAAYAGNPLHKAVLLLGPGRNGKSKLLALQRALIGPANVASVPLQVLAENRFAAAAIFGKLANICGDLDARAVKRTDTFKMLTGDDPIHAEHKYRDPFHFRSFALPMFSANEAPISSDQTDAWFARWLVVPMENTFVGAKADPFLEAKITGRGELEGLLVKAVAGLRRLMARGYFELPAPIARAGEQYRTRLDTVQAFITEECEVDPEASVDKTTLYRDYRTWAQDGGRLALSAVNFNEKVAKTHPGRIEETRRHGRRMWLGLGRATVDLTTTDTEVKLWEKRDWPTGDNGDARDPITNPLRPPAWGKVEKESPPSPLSPDPSDPTTPQREQKRT